MKIILNNTLAINILVFIIFPILIFYKAKFYKNKEYNINNLVKSNTDALKGLSVIIVILSHISMFTINKGIMAHIFINTGFLAVAVFLFVSGYGLAEQFRKRKNYLNGFVLDKIVRLYLIFFISNVIVTILNNYFLGSNYNIKNILISSVSMNFANGRELWFVATILFFYLAFYISFKYFKDKNSMILICIFLIIYILLCKKIGKGTWWYNTAICFPIGVLLSFNKYKIFNFIKEKYIINLFLSILLFTISMFLYIRGYSKLQFIIPIIFIYFVYTALIKIEINSKSMCYINKISFEMYLIHLVILQIAFKADITRNSIYLVVLFPIMIVLSIITKWICDTLFKGIKRILD